jgi:ribA/ribD-fused uncharacterized protein
MAKIISFLTPSKKRDRNSSTESEGTPARKKYTLTQTDFLSTIPKEYTIDDIPEDTMDEPVMTDTKEIPSKTSHMETRPDWAQKLLNEVKCISAQQIKDSLTLNSISLRHDVLEAKLDEALMDLNIAKSNISALTKKNEQLTHEIVLLKKKGLVDDNYSRKNNLKFFGIPEMPNESYMDLMNKLATVLRELDLNLANFSVDNIHRLPSNGNGPRPVIVKFCSHLDRQLIWKNTYLLKNSNLKVTVREHFAPETEKNIRTLLPIRREALRQNLKVRMVSDKLYINQQMYTVETMHNLPFSLRPENVTEKVIDNHIFFFTGASRLSNFHPAPFTVDDTRFINSEQYIQAKKSSLFKSPEVTAKIMASSNPGEMKRLTKNLPNFCQKTWEENAQEIAHTAILHKFQQNKNLLQYLISTGDKVLVEASPYDKWWGIGLDKDEKNILGKKMSWGKNVQGSILMRVRREMS